MTSSYGSGGDPRAVVGIFRKRETYNEQMLREAGLDRVVFNALAPGPASTAEPEVPTAEPRSLGSGSAGAGGVRPSPWDVTATVTSPASKATSEFTVLPDGDLIVTDETGDGDLSPFADAIERTARLRRIRRSLRGRTATSGASVPSGSRS